MATPETTTFRTCPLCSTFWSSREAFLSDPTIRLDGYQANLISIETGLLLFTHIADACRTTIAFPVSQFADLFTGPRYTERKAETPECPRLCFQNRNLERCNAACECTFAREIIQAIRNRQASAKVSCPPGATLTSP